VVTVFSDDNKKYLSTDLMRNEPEKEGFFAPHVSLLEFQSFRRVWQTCCNPQECREMAASDRLDTGRPAYCPLIQGKPKPDKETQ